MRQGPDEQKRDRIYPTGFKQEDRKQMYTYKLKSIWKDLRELMNWVVTVLKQMEIDVI